MHGGIFMGYANNPVVETNRYIKKNKTNVSKIDTTSEPDLLKERF